MELDKPRKENHKPDLGTSIDFLPFFWNLIRKIENVHDFYEQPVYELTTETSLSQCMNRTNVNLSTIFVLYIQTQIIYYLFEFIFPYVKAMNQKLN